MRPLASAAESLALDARIQDEWRVPGILLMENAAMRMWAALEETARSSGLFPPRGSARPLPLVVALAGPGNNGGDALAMLRHARFGGHERLAAVLATSSLTESGRLQRECLVAMGIPVIVFGEEEAKARELISGAALLVDGLAGTGLKGPLRRETEGLVHAARASGAAVAAIDLPSGLRDAREPSDSVLPATWTLAIEPQKLSLYHPEARALAGEILSIGGVFPPESHSGLPASLLEEGDLAGLLPRLPADVHKGRRGRVAVFAGSAGMTGAPRLVCRGAFAAAAGLVTLHVDKDLYPALSSGAADLGPAIVRPMDVGLSELKADAFAIGPGWGSSGDRASLLASLLEDGRPAVLDADGLRLLAPLLRQGFRAQGPLVLTPHPGEFEALTGIPAGTALARPAAPLRELAAKAGAVVVLKSHVTWIAAPDGRLAVFDGREASLAVAGSGDVLAGLCAGLLARSAASGSPAGADAFACAEAAVLAHGLAGREARKDSGWYEAAAIAEAAARCLDPPAPFL